MKKKRSVLLAIVLVLILTGCSATPAEPEVEEGVFPGYRAASFTLQDISGEAVSLDQFEGKSVLLIFWTSW